VIGIVPVWAAPFGVGFALSFSLILAIGAQNAFVLRQGLLRRHVGPLVLFCALADAALIIAGVGGLAPMVAHSLAALEAWVFLGAALWLGVYGGMRGYAAWRGQAVLEAGSAKQKLLLPTMLIAAVLTFGNPHVYLDTVVLIGTVSLQFEGADKLAYAVGAVCASFTFFTGLGYGAALLSGFMTRPHAWRVLDASVALVMLVLAFGMARAGGWV